MMEKIGDNDFCAIVASNDRAILDACLLRSPDIADGRIPLTVIEGASSIAAAYNEGLRKSGQLICLFLHQDVYLPTGWLDRAVKCLNALTEAEPAWRVSGPYGVKPDGDHIGRVWDVTLGRELGRSGFSPTPVCSLDELLLIVRRDDGVEFDPELPHFHLYGTDIVQSALADGRTAFAVELPVVHNNRPVQTLYGGYMKAYHYARRKWASQLPIPTTICPLSNNPFDLWRAQFRRKRARGRRKELLADAVTIAQAAHYE